MSGETRHTIGELARRTGLSVKTIRYYADSGIVPPTDRSPGRLPAVRPGGRGPVGAGPDAA
ncbi:MerR family DNA-binding transcriptional regulator [Micromonospora sp. NPDC005171]|uniref:MerR family DNA-binding transcriptional regulator n=1 Tax=Micromonospora sp. NPDC005171 TaxID=3156866 RepID=UPI0033B112AE